MAQIGTIQGRLLPPINGQIQAFPSKRWKEEFASAKKCGLKLIEWIFEGDGWKANPLIANPVEILKEKEKHGIEVNSVIADFFMDYPLIRVSKKERSERMDIFSILIERAHETRLQFINIPFVDNSEIRTEEELNQVAEVMKQLLPHAQKRKITLALETSLNPENFLRLLKTIDHPYIKANYDIGNSASLGYDPKEELDAYGEWIATIHVKDREKGGKTVPLGDGDADFDTIFSMLAELGYNGFFILQAARYGDEHTTLKKYVSFTQKYLNKYF